MLQHPDPIIQSLFDDITEQRDIAMVKVANLKVAVNQQLVEIAALKAKLPPEPDAQEKPVLEVVQ